MSHVRFVIFREQDENDSSGSQLKEFPLNSQMHVTREFMPDLQTFQSILAQHSTPKGVIQINRQCFPSRSRKWTQTSADEKREGHLSSRAERLARHEIQGR